MSAPVELREFRGPCQADRWKEGLPPPPNQVHSPVIRECSIPRQPAKPWDRSSDGEDSDEGVDNGEKLCEDSDSTMETESECPTEIYVPGLLEKKPSSRAGAQPAATNRAVGEAMSSVSSQSGSAQRQSRASSACTGPILATASVSARGRLIDAATAACDDAAMNIDSGISNETGGENATATSGECGGGGCTGMARLRHVISDGFGGDATSAASSRYSSSYSCGSRGDAHPPMMPGQGIRERELIVYMKHQKKLRIVSVLSGCYGMAVVMLSVLLAAASNRGVPLQQSEQLPKLLRPSQSPQHQQQVQGQQPAAATGTVLAIQIYYLCLYTTGLVFLAYSYMYALRARGLRQRLAKQRHRQQAAGAPSTAAARPYKLISTAATSSAPPARAGRVSSGSRLHPDVGSLFLRLCTAAFCICCMVDNGIEFGVKLSSGCSSVVDTVHPMAQLVFAFSQMYFIFVNSQMCLRRHLGLAKFGVAHLAATNLSIWVHRLIQGDLQTVAESGGTSSSSRSQQQLPLASLPPEAAVGVEQNATATVERQHPSCFTGNPALHELLHSAEPYLTRLTIQYCLLSTAILCALWSSLGRTAADKAGPASTPCTECAERSLQRRADGTRTIDCRRTGLGLAAGVVVLVAAVASLIAYYTLRRIVPDVVLDVGAAGGSSRPDGGSSGRDAATAELLLACYQLAAYCITLVVAVAMLLKLRQLDYNECRSTTLEDALLGIGTAAVLGRDVHVMVAASEALSAGSNIRAITTASGAAGFEAQWLVILTACAFDLLQSFVQSTAIALALRLQCRDSQDSDIKPGRQCVSFLLVSNVALWAACTFAGSSSVPSMPAELSGGGSLLLSQYAWLQPLLTYILEPVALGYRLAAAACLADVWHELYRSPRTDLV